LIGWCLQGKDSDIGSGKVKRGLGRLGTSVLQYHWSFKNRQKKLNERAQKIEFV